MKYVIAIDTNKYAGSFEREMCAYITGQVGECGVGDPSAAEEELSDEERDWFEDNCEHRADDNGCCRPTYIYQDKNDQYNSVALFFYELPPQKIIDLIKERANSFGSVHLDGKSTIKILGFRLVLERLVKDEKEL